MHNRATPLTGHRNSNFFPYAFVRSFKERYICHPENHINSFPFVNRYYHASTISVCNHNPCLQPALMTLTTIDACNPDVHNHCNWCLQPPLVPATTIDACNHHWCLLMPASTIIVSVVLCYVLQSGCWWHKATSVHDFGRSADKTEHNKLNMQL